MLFVVVFAGRKKEERRKMYQQGAKKKCSSRKRKRKSKPNYRNSVLSVCLGIQKGRKKKERPLLYTNGFLVFLTGQSLTTGCPAT